MSGRKLRDSPSPAGIDPVSIRRPLMSGRKHGHQDAVVYAEIVSIRRPLMSGRKRAYARHPTAHTGFQSAARS